MRAQKLISALTVLTMLPVSGVVGTSTASAAATVNVVLNPANSSPFNGGRFEGWGTALCWWANRIGYDPTMTQQAAELFYSKDGLNLNIARYNLGGGDDPSHNHITRSDSKVPGIWESFELSENGNDVTSITYDMTNDQNQLNVAKAALAANPDVYFEGFSNSAPYFMTVTGCTGGGDPADSDNLKSEMYDDFANFIADGTMLLKDNGIEFKSYSPMNEPDTNYWGVNSAKQEGCHFSPGDSQSKMIIETRKALDAAGLENVLVAGMDETDINKTVTNYAKLSDEAKTALGRIDTHTYSGSNRAGAKKTAADAGKDLWMSEVDGGWNMFGLADRIILDINGMQPSAWVMWDIVDSHKDSTFVAPDGSYSEKDRSLNVTGSLWGVAMADHDAKNIELSNKYYGFGQFTKYINPGDTIIGSSNSTLAAYNRESGDIKIVVTNSSGNDIDYVYDLSSFSNVGTSVKEIRSNNAAENAEHWAVIENGAVLEGKKLTSTAKAGTITTYVIEGEKDTPVNYGVINGIDTYVKNGVSKQLGIATDCEGDVQWSVSDTSKASITDDGMFTALAAGDVTIYANLGDFTVEKNIRIQSYTVSGTPSWGNSSTRPSDSADYLKAVDNDTSTYFDGTTGGWVMYDYGTPFKATTAKLAARSGNGMAARTVGAKIQASNDAVTWTDLYTVTTALSTSLQDVELNNTKAYRYYRYINTENMANVAEFQLEGEASDDIPNGDPSVETIDGFTDDFENRENIFGAEIGSLSSTGAQVFSSGLERFGNVFAPVKTTSSVKLDKAVELTSSDTFRLRFNMFAGWESSGKANTFVLKDKNGSEIAAIYLTGGGYTLQEIRIGGTNVMSGTAVSQCRSNPGTSKAGANGWDVSGQPYVNTVGYNKTAEIIIDGSGAVTVSFTGGMADTVVTGTLTGDVSVSEMVLTGDYNTAVNRIVSYDNFRAEVIHYTAPAVTPEPTATPIPLEQPNKGETLISLDFSNGLTSGAAYGKAEAMSSVTTQVIDGKTCLKLDNTASTAVKLTDANGDNLLKGIDEMMISFDVKPTSNSASWWFYAAPDDAAQTYQKEKYIGVFSQNGTVKAERYKNSGSRPASNEGACEVNAWNSVLVSVSKTGTDLYINGTLADSVESSYAIADILGSEPTIYIGRANWGSGEYASGYIANFEIKYDSVSPVELDIPSTVKKDITLPTEGDGWTAVWTSSNENIISSTGKVTRPLSGDEEVTLTAAVSMSGLTLTQTYTVMVKSLTSYADTFAVYYENGNINYTTGYEEGENFDMYVVLRNDDGTLAGVKRGTACGSFAAEPGRTYTAEIMVWDENKPVRTKTAKIIKCEDDSMKTEAYVFAHFVGTEADASQEQIYLSVSEDGQVWTQLNGGKPILTSTVGEQGVRDPYILRGRDGKYFIIATDLSIYNRRVDSNRWSTCQTSGSRSIVIWESTDLVNWSEARLVEVADKNAGCTWAPEAVYDNEKDAYMVFWASKVSDDGYAQQRMYRSYTKDFVTFTEPEIYMDGDHSNIDTTIIEEKGVYYRFTKNESRSSVIMEKSTSLSGPWSDVDGYSLIDMTGYEGPTIYKLNGENKWCLLLDYYSKSQGYKPFVTDDIAGGNFTAATDFTFPVKFRHGTVMPITRAEYEALTSAYTAAE